MRYVISTACLGGVVEEKLRAAAAAGFDGVELVDIDLFCFDGDPRELRSIAADLGLSIEAFQSLRGFDGGARNGFVRDLDRAEYALDLAQALGAPMLVLQASSTESGFANQPPKAIENARDLAERAARRGIRIAYGGVLREDYAAPRLRQLLEVVADIDHPHFGVVVNSLDSFGPGDMAEYVSHIPAERLFLVQLADAISARQEGAKARDRIQCLPGEGDLELHRIVAAAIAAGYIGPLSIGVASDELRALEVRQAAQDAYRSLQFVEEQVRRRPQIGRASPGRSGAAQEAALFDPPEPAAIQATSFLEFGVDADMEAKLGGWLSRFGFARTGKHHAKAVTLYEAGGARVVLNAEPDSVAQAFYRLHGASACNFGLSVTGARHALARALAFGCQRFDERRGPHDTQINSVRAPNGSLLSFVDSASESNLFRGGEFGAPNDPPGGPSGVDHLGLAVPRGELDSWLLFYRTVLGLNASPPQALSDPYGMVRSRALVNEARTIRLALNVSESRRTETAQSVAANVGALLQQIAFRCDDLLEFATRLKQLGAPILRIPGSYYDHLAATSDLDARFVDELRVLNILYDRMGEGEFLHCYSESFEGRFFFEFVQRRAGYDGYGSRNAPFRLAAQARARLQNAPPVAL